MKLPLKALLAATALGLANIATPAYADIIAQPSSASQGTLVHTDGEEQGTDVTGTLGSGPTAPVIVHFQGTTDAEAPNPNNVVHLQQGNGQAELTGIELGGNDAANLLSGDIFLNAVASGGGSPSDPTNIGMEWIELAFQGVTADTVTFTLTLFGEPDFVQAFDLDPNGENKFIPDLAAAPALGEQAQDLDLSRAEVRRSRACWLGRWAPAHELVDGLQHRLRVLVRPAEGRTLDEDESSVWYP